jgi:hypothetical protein
LSRPNSSSLSHLTINFSFFKKKKILITKKKILNFFFTWALSHKTFWFRPSLAVTNNTVWKAPESGWLKVNWDASVEKNQGRMGFGVVVRNEKGDVIAAQCQSTLGLFDPAVAEARAALLGVPLCRECGFMRVHFEGDAQTVVNAVNSQ